ncbi:MAG TPA: hypothetical protein P5184_06035, partial [Bacteroidales bacterium]|nr:hypothetical protein [Bacteroidales bacterium]
PVTLRVYDPTGKIIATLIENKTLQPGKYVERFDPASAGISPGMYYLSMISNNVMMNRKMIYMK